MVLLLLHTKKEMKNVDKKFVIFIHHPVINASLFWSKASWAAAACCAAVVRDVADVAIFGNSKGSSNGANGFGAGFA